jgi:hypothetical protein
VTAPVPATPWCEFDTEAAGWSMFDVEDLTAHGQAGRCDHDGPFIVTSPGAHPVTHVCFAHVGFAVARATLGDGPCAVARRVAS